MSDETAGESPVTEAPDGQQIIEDVKAQQQVEGPPPGGPVQHPAMGSFYTTISAAPVQTSAYLDIQSLPIQKMVRGADGQPRIIEEPQAFVRLHIGTQSGVQCFFFDAENAEEWGEKLASAGRKLKLLVVPGQMAPTDLKNVQMPRPGLT